MLPLLLLLVVITNIFSPTTSLPDGAPESVCDTMLPFHGGGIQPQTSASPFFIAIPASAVGQGQTIHIEIQSNPPELTYGGFMIQARSTSPPYRVIGRFAPSVDGLVKLMNCDGVDNAATHVNTGPKKDLGLTWQAPNDFLGEVVFNATVAQQYDKFWVGIESEPIQVVQKGVSPSPTTGISTTRPPFQQTTPAYNPEGVREDPIYRDCGRTKSCFGFPDGCVSSRTCQTIGTVIVRGDNYQFEIQSDHNSPAYVAIGLSEDDKMGDDSVMECLPQGGTIQAYTSWTRGMPNYGASRDQVPQNIIRLLQGSYEDGVIYCRIERIALSQVQGHTIDLVNNKYHLLVASGSSVRENSVGYHDIGRIASAEPRFLAEISELSGKSNLFLRLHAAFMLTAWIGTASIGILLARYFKQTWVGSSLCGKDQWFAWHRTFMILTWSLTIAAFVLIFVELGGWSAEQNPHAILGTITTFLCFIQPFMAAFRPAPSAKRRAVFNWAHWLVGNLAHILAIVTIFFAVKLTKAELPDWFDWILVAFVAFHVFMHLVLSISGCVSDRSHSQRVNTFPMTDITPNRNNIKERKMDAPFASLRKVLLTVYLVIVILFVIALILIAVLAPIEETVRDLRRKLTKN